jgi:hypothetical protein
MAHWRLGHYAGTWFGGPYRQESLPPWNGHVQGPQKVPVARWNGRDESFWPIDLFFLGASIPKWIWVGYGYIDITFLKKCI